MLHTHADPMNMYFTFDGTHIPTLKDPELTDWILWEDWPTKNVGKHIIRYCRGEYLTIICSGLRLDTPSPFQGDRGYEIFVP